MAMPSSGSYATAVYILIAVRNLLTHIILLYTRRRGISICIDVDDDTRDRSFAEKKKVVVIKEVN
jgi:hypothetical protein